MRHVTAIGILPLLLATALPAQAQMVTISPEQIGQIFCIGSLGNDMAPVEGMLSDDLSVEIANAWARNAGFVEQAPDEKPPLGDGLPWRTYPDYADGCSVGEALMERESASVVINYTFKDYPDANYSNELLLVPSTSADGATPLWRINDIDLGEGMTFRKALAGAFESY